MEKFIIGTTLMVFSLQETQVALTKKHVDNKNHVEIKYPQKWIVKENPSTIFFITQNSLSSNSFEENINLTLGKATWSANAGSATTSVVTVNPTSTTIYTVTGANGACMVTKTFTVVLSACETGLGNIRTANEVLGLRRVFRVAGCKSIIMALWNVPDKETSLLMKAFYENLKKGYSPHKSLRNAQLHLKSITPNPLFWGAFICEGYLNRGLDKNIWVSGFHTFVNTILKRIS